MSLLVVVAWLGVILTGCTGLKTDVPLSTPTSSPVSSVSSPIPATPRSSALPGAEPPSSIPVDPAPTDVQSSPLVPPTDSPTVLPPVSTPASNPKSRQKISLQAVLNYDAHTLAVNEQIDYTNNTAITLPDLLLVVEPLRYPGTFHLEKINWAGDNQAVENLSLENQTLHVPLRQPLLPGESVSLTLYYLLTLPSPAPSEFTRPVPFGYTERQTNLVDWYPFIPPYQPDTGWLAHPPGYFGEHQVYELTDFTVDLRLAGGRQDLVVAASSPAERVDDQQRFELDAARSFAISISHAYEVYTTTVPGPAGDIQVLSYAFPVHRQAGKAALEASARALELYSRLFGQFPDRSLSVVEADFLDGMEYSNLFFLSYGFYNTYQGQPGDYLIAIAAHETAHQWWFGRVGNDQALEPWLDEALCTYSERLFYENTSPDALAWWWAYRVNYYEPRGWVDSSIYSFGGEQQPFRTYRDAVYLNGAKFLEELRGTVGDQVFFAFLKDYYSQEQNQIASAADFFRILGQHTSQDLSPIISRYFKNR